MTAAPTRLRCRTWWGLTVGDARRVSREAGVVVAAAEPDGPPLRP